MAKTPEKIIGITHPYDSNPSEPKRITRSKLQEAVRDAIHEPHIDLDAPIEYKFRGANPPKQMLYKCRQYRKFIDDGLADPRTGLQLSAVINCKSFSDFEKCIEAWYSNPSNGWTVIT